MRTLLIVLWPVTLFILVVGIRESVAANAVRRRLGGLEREPLIHAQRTLDAGTKKVPRSLKERWSMGPAAAALRLRISEYLLFRALSFIVPFLLGLLLRGVVGGLILGLVGLLGLTFYFRFKQRRWLQQAEEALPEFLRGVTSALRAGSSLSQAMGLVAQETPGPLGDEVRRILKREALGFGTAETLQEMSRRIPSRDLGLAVMAISIQREVGGSLADVLENITHTIVDRQRLKSEIRVLSAQGRYSGWLLTVLPFGLGLLLWFTDPSYMGSLLSTHIGWGMLGGSLVSVSIGGVIINRLVKAPEM
ncbi:type II secretion system F family protein [Sulfobacillus harzensis]|uniref:Type II secretion system protein F n=1 Tax=Sulfobacillus harzensis TaxID=2729629 RepID=A0A7Y0Q4I2_9FIRM|nr:type II secretion system F family protein [Sulfobacillus harzensis]NMP24440.1 type II secretion system protein F [Sulfobacillus harzensis]